VRARLLQEQKGVGDLKHRHHKFINLREQLCKVYGTELHI